MQKKTQETEKNHAPGGELCIATVTVRSAFRTVTDGVFPQASDTCSIRLSGPALGRPRKDESRNKVQDYKDECERVEVERKFSLAKRKCGMGLVTAKLQETAAHVLAMSVLLLNLRKIQYAFLRLFEWMMALGMPYVELAIVQ